jgi:hypothetical protein
MVAEADFSPVKASFEARKGALLRMSTVFAGLDSGGALRPDGDLAQIPI